MKKRHLLFVIILLGLFFSCSKDDVEFPLTLHSIEVVENGEIRMFIGGKEIFDQEIIANFTNNGYFNLQNIKVSEESVTFPERDSVMFSWKSKKYHVEKHKKQFVFTCPDMMWGDDSYCPSKVCDEKGNYKFLTYKTSVKLLYGVGGVLHFVKDIIPAHGDYNKLGISYISFKYSYNLPTLSMDDDYIGTIALKGIANEFNGDVSFLEALDTLAVQEYRMVFGR